MSKLPIVGTVVRIIILRAREILLVQSRRTIERDEWELPGGKVEDGETLYEAVTRELFEETRLELINGHKIIDWFRETPFKTTWRYAVFEASAFVGTIRIGDPDEIKDVRWHNVTNMPKLDEHTTALFKKFAESLPTTH